METTVRRSWKLQEFVAHKANVNCLAMGHKSSQVLATGGDDKKVNLWAIGRQNCLMSLSGHTTPVECVCFGHSEDLVCAGSQTGALKIWDLEAAKLFRNFTGHKGAIKCMDFHPYGDYLTTGSCDSNIKLWDTRKSECIVTYSSHRLAVNSLQFSPDGQWIASACEEGLIKVWDVRVGKVLREFTEHSAAVTCVKFHPHEFLLASCGMDCAVNFWDMEKFQIVSKFERDNTSIKHMQFSEDGAILLGCGNDGLHVIGWEPARLLDVVPRNWGHIHDLTVAQTQLITGSSHSTYVVLSVVDLSMVHPYGDPPHSVLPSPLDVSPFQKSQSVRKSFSKKTPSKEVMHQRLLPDEKIIEESTSGTEPDEDLGTVISSVKDYTKGFHPSRALNRTPPPVTTNFSEEEYSLALEVPELKQDVEISKNLCDLRLSPPARHISQPSPPQRYRTDSYSRIPTLADKKSEITFNISSGLRPSNSDIALGPASLEAKSLSYTGSHENIRQRLTDRVTSAMEPLIMDGERRVEETQPAPEFIPFTSDRPVGLDLDEFLPQRDMTGGRARGAAAELSEQEVLGVLMGGHDSMMTVLTARQRALQIFHSVRVNKGLKAALESVIALEDNSVIVDILNVMAHKPSMWNLDICLLMLPKIFNLLQSKYESYMQCGCNALRLVVRNFSSVVQANVNSPIGTLGVDIPREERYAKCLQIHQLLVDIRAFLLKRQTLQGRLGAAFRDLHTLMEQGLD